MSRPWLLRWVICWLAGLLAAHAGAQVEVKILQPTGEAPVFGEVEVQVLAVADDGIRQLTLFLDGQPVETFRQPPYRVRVGVGSSQRPHRFEAVAESFSGEEGRHEVVTPAVGLEEALVLNLKQLYITVERRGERILDLDRSRFKVFDNGRRQEIVTFEGGDVPFVATLLVDASSSMRGARLQAALAGARAFIAGLRTLDQARLLLFSDHVVHATPFTGYRELLETGLSGVAADGDTALNDHLYLALKGLETRQGRRVVVLLSDGIDVASVLTMERVLETVRGSEAMIYWIRPGSATPQGMGHASAWRDAAGHRAELQGLHQAVELSGGRIVPLASIAAAPEAFAEVLAELRQQYVVGYYPSSEAGPGSEHRVRVEVGGRGLTVRLREIYLERAEPE